MKQDPFLAATFDLLESAPEDQLLIERRTMPSPVTLKPQRGDVSIVQLRHRLAALEAELARLDALERK